MLGDLKPYPNLRHEPLPWIGRVPSHWDVRPMFGTYSPKSVKNTGMRENTVLSLSYGQIKVRPVERLHGLVPESFETYQIIEPNDIIVRTTDLQNDRTSLRVGISPYSGIITSAYMCLQVRPDIGPQYGYFLLNAYDLLKILYGYGSGLRQSLDFAHIKRLPLAIPPVDEQTAIVRFVNHFDRRIREYILAKQKLIKLLEEQKQAIVHQAVTRGLDPNVKFKPSGVEWLGEVPEHWIYRRLKQVSVVQTGITLGKTYSGGTLSERPYLRVANVQAGRLTLARVKTVKVPDEEAARSTLQPGDVLMTEGGDIDKLGRGCVWHGEIQDCLHQNHVFAVRPLQRSLLPDFLAALMGSQHGRRYFQLTAKQTTNLAATNSTTLGNFPMLLPDVEEQERILQCARDQTSPLADAVAVAEREVQLLRELRTSLIADVVTGKLDVREAAAALPDEPLEALFEPELESEDADEPEAEEVAE